MACFVDAASSKFQTASNKINDNFSYFNNNLFHEEYILFFLGKNKKLSKSCYVVKNKDV